MHLEAETCLRYTLYVQAPHGLSRCGDGLACHRGDSIGAWPLVGESRHSKAWSDPLHGELSDSLIFPAMPALSRQGSQVPLLQLHKLVPEVNTANAFHIQGRQVRL